MLGVMSNAPDFDRNGAWSIKSFKLNPLRGLA